jgi:hypothetical protein
MLLPVRVDYLFQLVLLELVSSSTTPSPCRRIILTDEKLVIRRNGKVSQPSKEPSLHKGIQFFAS